MAGIAGIARADAQAEVAAMLDRMAHRGRAGRAVFSVEGITLGVCWPASQAGSCRHPKAIWDRFGGVHCAEARVRRGALRLRRDAIGAAPLYYGVAADGATAFASELKALYPVATELRPLPPGAMLEGRNVIPNQSGWRRGCLAEPPAAIAAGLRAILDEAVWRCVAGDNAVGAWLSGGLDSSIMAALARPDVEPFHTFAIGLPSSPDLAAARTMAAYLKSAHHEIVVTPKTLAGVLPDVIRHLESFDALLVRSSALNFILAREAVQFVPTVLSGEGGDELFAGYDNLRALEPDALGDELIALTDALPGTALQRVDRCAAAHGLLVHLGFLDPDVVDYAFRIAPDLKIRGGVEKWILREAVAGLLPEAIRRRPKAKFWDGAGLRNLFASEAEKTISDAAFARERRIGAAEPPRSKEELAYYRLFREIFEDRLDPALVTRTRRAGLARGARER